MKKIIIIIIIILLFISSNVNAEEEKRNTEIPYQIVEEQLESLNIEEITNMIKEVNNTTEGYFGDMDFKNLIKKIVKGEKIFEEDKILNGFLKLISDEFIKNIDLLLQILLLSIISAILINLQNSFDNESISKIANFIVYIILISIIIKSFVVALNIGKDTINNMVMFMQILLPILITLLMAVGGLTSSALLHPLILGSLGILSTLIKQVIIPLLFFSTILSLVNKITDKIQINRIASLLREISVIIIGGSLTIFMGIMTIQGVSASQLDGLTIRTAKFAIDNLVPVVGGFLSDAMDTVVGCSLLLKNSIGIIAVIVLFLIIAIPAFKLLSLIFIYRLTAAIIEPISDEKIVDSLIETSKSIIIILGLLLIVTVMFVISIAIIIGAGNITLMMR
ncbi:stage III sporulation protein AE [Senegalia massiliensis]|uniref:Stage III sporulation protein AE n=1 Tax=Senegalia massiliensis TaxID=1720316 RepID=A0A845QWJ1_9CLOT|nr:stage III sporulation protein AE [Senegalia massiliensis]NBI06651.1 stage III sporulation protein AE [Senegalia massiliensis]